ncbi:4-hydroxy-tetrahydrodipicolinate synthase, chloroplastic-like isoform X2 [Rhodamnia argentea]|nr:4-hydroxy-tetrahydrodipicolinate synthase, chloroplastic-like isoform X2 [Rhodamnia argentea]
MVHNLCLTMRSHEIQSRTLVEDIRSLRLITGIKTPYLLDGRLDLKAYDGLINMQITQGVEGVIVGGPAGEGHLMSWDEHISLIGHTVARFGASLKVIGNTGSNSTGEAMQATEQGFAVGMHASLQINPYCGKTSIPGVLAHFNSVLPMGPMIIYNMPSRTGQDILPCVIQTLSASPNFVGIKECAGNDRVRQYAEDGKTVWCGMDHECHDARWDLGATGAMSVTSNLIPGLIRELVAGKKSPSLNKKLMPLIEWLLHEPALTGLNTALAQLGVVWPVFRLPYVPLPLSKRQEFVRVVEDIGREHFVGEREVQVLDDNDFILVGRY